MAHIFFQLGSNQEISRREIESVFSVETEVLSGNAFTSLPSQLVKGKFHELGGVMRAGRLLSEEKKFEALSDRIIEDCLKQREEGKKMRVGIHFSSKNGWKQWGITLQKNIKEASKTHGFSVRVVNRGPLNLDSFAVQKEKLLEKGNAEYCCISLPTGWGLGKTLQVQHAQDFAFRDMKKPVRDMKTGMLPPKLARMMINLARDEKGALPDKIYDPFCGTGTVLIEGLSLDLKVAGSDISKQMVEATKKNTQWYYNSLQKYEEGGILGDDNREPYFLRDIFVKDATKDFYPDHKKKINNATVVAEGFLGKIFHNPVSKGEYVSQKELLFPLYRQFLFLLSKEKVNKMVFGFPFWVGKGEDERFSFVADLLEFATKIGWKKVGKTLFYAREKQVVGREIVILEKN